jgi:hypothetical protein
MGQKGVYWIDVAQDASKWSVRPSTVMKYLTQ